MKNWHKAFADEMFWILYFRLFLEKKEYDVVWQNQAFSDLVENLYGKQEGKNKIILKYPQNYELHIIFSGDPDQGSTDAFYLHHPTFASQLYLGDDSPHFSLPIFRFEEFEALTSQVQVDPKYVPLLLLKTVGITNENSYTEVQQKVFSFFKEANLFETKIQELLPTLLPIHTNLTWEHDNIYGWVNNAGYSRRKKNETNKKLSFFLKNVLNSH